MFGSVELITDHRCRFVSSSIKCSEQFMVRCETWPPKIEDICRLQVFNQGCLWIIASMFMDYEFENAETGHRALDNYGKSVDKVVNLYHLRWFEHVLRIPIHRIPWYMMMADIEVD